MVRQDITANRHKILMVECEYQLNQVLDKKKFAQNLSLGDLLTVWQRVMSKRKNPRGTRRE